MQEPSPHPSEDTEEHRVFAPGPCTSGATAREISGHLQGLEKVTTRRETIAVAAGFMAAVYAVLESNPLLSNPLLQESHNTANHISTASLFCSEMKQ